MPSKRKNSRLPPQKINPYVNLSRGELINELIMYANALSELHHKYAELTDTVDKIRQVAFYNSDTLP